MSSCITEKFKRNQGHKKVKILFFVCFCGLKGNTYQFMHNPKNVLFSRFSIFFVTSDGDYIFSLRTTVWELDLHIVLVTYTRDHCSTTSNNFRVVFRVDLYFQFETARGLQKGNDRLLCTYNQFPLNFCQETFSEVQLTLSSF